MKRVEVVKLAALFHTHLYVFCRDARLDVCEREGKYVNLQPK